MLDGAAMKHEVPIEVRLGLRVLLRHIQEPPGWHNCKFVVERWLNQIMIDERIDEAEHRLRAEDTPA